MKPFKKPLESSPHVIPQVKTLDTLISVFNELADSSTSRLSKQDDLPEIFVIPTRDIPPKELKNLAQKGMIIKPKDDLISRLLKMEKANRHFRSLSITDELTGLYNKRFFNKQLKIEITRSKRTGAPFCMMIIDLDNFKSINDTMGHAKGDEFLVKICRQINQQTRPTDFACRYGGDEFAAILPETFLLDGIMIAQRWHELILKVARQMKVKVSSSIGIDEFNTNCAVCAAEFFNKVDQVLYSAKRTGKNKISYPDLMNRSITEAKSVTPKEKDSLYKAFGQLKQQNKKRGEKG